MIDLVWFAVGLGCGVAVPVSAWALYRWRSTRRKLPSWLRAEWPPAADASSPEPSRRNPDSRGSAGLGGKDVPGVELRLSERILVQLGREGRLDADTTARPGRTQAGLAETVDSNRNAVSKVLRRLVAAGILTEERRHVSGLDQRVKVYDLTLRGEALAREVARRHHASLLPARTPPPVDGRPESDRPPWMEAR